MFQSDREKSEGLPVAPFMDRDKVTKPTAQIGFLKFVLIPMFETVTKVGQPRPEPDLGACGASTVALTCEQLAVGIFTSQPTFSLLLAGEGL